jgi:lipid-A-disaccharide synthase
MLEVAARLRSRHPDARFVIPAASPALRRTIETLSTASPVPVEVIEGRSHEVMARLATAVVASGTATLELALLGVPMVVVYPVGWHERLLRPALLIAPHFALVNVAAGRRVVEERLVSGRETEAREIAEGLARLHADGPDRDRVRRELGEVAAGLAGRGAADRAARAVLRVARRRGSGADR